jgi:hypothetical protein
MLMSVVISVLTISRTRYSALQWTKIDQMTMTTTTTTMTMMMTMTVRTTLLQIRYVLLGLLYLLPPRPHPEISTKGPSKDIFHLWLGDLGSSQSPPPRHLVADVSQCCTSGLPVQPETTVTVQGSELTIV